MGAITIVDPAPQRRPRTSTSDIAWPDPATPSLIENHRVPVRGQGARHRQGVVVHRRRKPRTPRERAAASPTESRSASRSFDRSESRRWSAAQRTLAAASRWSSRFSLGVAGRCPIDRVGNRAALAVQRQHVRRSRSSRCPRRVSACSTAGASSVDLPEPDGPATGHPPDRDLEMNPVSAVTSSHPRRKAARTASRTSAATGSARLRRVALDDGWSHAVPASPPSLACVFDHHATDHHQQRRRTQHAGEHREGGAGVCHDHAGSCQLSK